MHGCMFALSVKQLYIYIKLIGMFVEGTCTYIYIYNCFSDAAKPIL